MDLFQCIPPGTRRRRQEEESSEEEEEQYAARVVRSVDRDVSRGRPQARQQQQIIAHPQAMRPRRQSLPSGYYTAPAGGYRPRHNSSRSGGSSGNGGGMRHWGSSLTLDSENSAGDLTSRTLRPRYSSLSRGTTPTREIVNTTPKKPWLPKMHREEVRHPQLRDYLEKPRLVNTLGCVDRKPPMSQFHATRMAQTERPAYRNLRLGNFMERPEPSGELIPDMLRQYYLDTYLGSYEFEYLKNFGEEDQPRSNNGRPVIHRGY